MSISGGVSTRGEKKLIDDYIIVQQQKMSC